MRFAPLRAGLKPAAALPLILGVLAAAPARAQDEPRSPESDLAAAFAIERALVKIIDDAESSIVSIARYKPDRGTALLRPDPFDLRDRRARSLQRMDGPGDPAFVPNEFGAGIIIAPRGAEAERFILTNYHVVEGGPVVGRAAESDGSELYVRLANRRGFHARILAADPRSDLAVLKIDYSALKLKPADLEPLPLARNYDFRKGRLVFALGNPYAIARDGSASVSWGLISNVSRHPAPPGTTLSGSDEGEETIHHFGTLLQVDTRLNLGTSGGALLNLKGELIGITTSLAALEGYEKSVGYAIPVDDATRRAIDELSQGYEVEYGFLGVGLKPLLPDEIDSLISRFGQSSAAKVDVVF
ncbi:MAG: S1C family serine protease [Planctomycetaceae bacterium]